MKPFFAIFFPPLAVLMTGRIGAFLFNCILTMMGWLPGVLHAFYIIRQNEEGGRHNEQMKSLREQKDLMMLQIEMSQLQHMQRMAADGVSDIPRHLRKRKK